MIIAADRYLVIVQGNVHGLYSRLDWFERSADNVR
jgi:hypothetical protein